MTIRAIERGSDQTGSRAVIESVAMLVEVPEAEPPSVSEIVDRQNRLIRGVKVLGLKSTNPAYVIGVDSDRPYEYDPEAVVRAIPLYEGARVYIDHPEFAMTEKGQRLPALASRPFQSVLGHLRNVRFDNGLVADLRYLERNPLTELVLEAALDMPHVVTLSHNADVTPQKRPDGSVVIVSIDAVRSVDLIGDKPGTTRTLFESLAQTTIPKSGATEMPEGQIGSLMSTSPADVIDASFRDKIIQLLDNKELDDQQLSDQVSALIEARGQIKQIADEALAGTAAADTPAEPIEEPVEVEEPTEVEMMAAEAGTSDDTMPATEAGAMPDDTVPAAEAGAMPDDTVPAAEAVCDTQAMEADQPAEMPKSTPAAESAALAQINARLARLEKDNAALRAREQARLELDAAEVDHDPAIVKAYAALESAVDRKSFVQRLKKSAATPEARTIPGEIRPESRPAAESSAPTRTEPEAEKLDFGQTGLFSERLAAR